MASLSSNSNITVQNSSLFSSLAENVNKLARNSGYETQCISVTGDFGTHSSIQEQTTSSPLHLVHDLIQRNRQKNQLTVKNEMKNQFNSTADFINTKSTFEKLNIVEDILSHIEKIVEKKPTIIQELQHPITSNTIPMHHTHHLAVMDFVRTSAALLENMNEYVESSRWISNEDWSSHSITLDKFVGDGQKMAAKLGQILYCMKTCRENLTQLLETKL